MSALSVKLQTPLGRWVVVIARLLVAGVFVGAAIPKLLDPATFAEDIANYRMVPDAAAGAIAVIVPVLEVVIALALIAGVEARGAALVAGVMLVGFVVAMGQAMARGIDVDCGCFGSAVRTSVGWLPIARNVGLLIACAVVLAAPDLPWTKLLGRARTGGPSRVSHDHR